MIEEKFEKIEFGNDARVKILNGVSTLTRAVSSTLGPLGKNVLINTPYGNKITKDGYNVAKSINLDYDFYESIGVSLIKEVSEKTVKQSGDGTTTATILSEYLMKKGSESIYKSPRINVTKYKKGMDAAFVDIEKIINSLSLKIENNEQLYNIAKISANGDEEIATIIKDALEASTWNGVINIEKSNTFDTFIETRTGLSYDTSVFSELLLGDNKNWEAENPFIFIINSKILNIQQILPIVEISIKRPVLLICNDMDRAALTQIISNKLNNGCNICVIKSPNFGITRDMNLDDISVTTGTNIFNKITSASTGFKLEDINQLGVNTLKCAGVCEKVIVNKDNFTIYPTEQKKPNIEKQIEKINVEIADESDESQHIDFLRERLARLSGGISIIKVGGISELEIGEKIDRIEDALCATKAAIDSGYVPGSSYAYITAYNKLENGNTSIYDPDDSFGSGYNLVISCLIKPLSVMINNCFNTNKFDEFDKIYSQYNDKGQGYDANNDEICNLIERGIIEPTKVPIVSLKNAVAVASMFLTLDTVIPSLN